jgi:hypothetical protein
MRKLVCILGLAVALCCTSCEETTVIGETAKLAIEIKLYYGDEPLAFGENYDYIEGTTIAFNKFAFYISDVGISDSDTGFETELFEIDFVNFGNPELPTPIMAQTYYRKSSNIPLGSYKKLNLGIGVNPELNLTIPSDYSNTHPLGQDDYFSEELNSYIFSNISGSFDLDGDLNADKEIGIQAGINELFQKVTIPIQLNLSKNETGILTFAFDIKKLFEQADGELVSINEIPEQYDETDSTFASSFMDRFPTAISLE